METGIVKFFDSRDNRRFGFITTETGWDIFFHFNDGEDLKSGKAPKRQPQKGDRIVFERSSGSKGPKASPWYFAEDYERNQKTIEDRPTYRVWKQDGWWPNEPDKQWEEPKIIWEGKNIKELCEKYPVPQSTGLYRRSHSSDPLISFLSLDDGLQVRHWFERQKPDGTWEKCEDPRPLSPVLRQVERANWR